MKFIHIVAFLVLYMSACAQTTTTNSRTPAAACASSGLALDAKRVGFNEDLLPVLNKYCVSCHANYGKISGLNTSSSLAQVVKLMSNGRMPTDGRRVPADQIQLFSAWEQAGFPATAAAAPASPATTTNGAGTTVLATNGAGTTVLPTNAAGTTVSVTNPAGTTAAAANKPIAAAASAAASTCTSANKAGS